MRRLDRRHAVAALPRMDRRYRAQIQFADCAVNGKGPGLKARGLNRNNEAKTILPAAANHAPVEIIPDDPAVPPIGIAVIVGVAAIAGAVAAVIITVAGTNAHTDADWTRTDPYALCLSRD